MNATRRTDGAKANLEPVGYVPIARHQRNEHEQRDQEVDRATITAAKGSRTRGK